MTEQLSIGEQIKQARLSLHLSQSELSKRCGILQTVISAVELGRNRIRALTLKKLEDGLGVKLNPLENELIGAGRLLVFTDMEYDLLRIKIKNLKSDEVLKLPGTAWLAQLIRMNLRKDHRRNQNIPIVRVLHSKENNEITISHRREILRGIDMKISKIDIKEVPPSVIGKYEELLEHAKKISDGQAIKIEFDNEVEAANAAASFGGYITRGRAPSNVQFKRKGKVLYLFK